MGFTLTAMSNSEKDVLYYPSAELIYTYEVCTNKCMR